jgi:bacillithiol system protein YtxJ
MDTFREANYISEIIEESQKNPTIIFKYSNSCITSERLRQTLEKELVEKRLTKPIFLVTVQTNKALSKNVEDYFEIKHESPQIILVNKGKVVYSKNHHHIKVADLLDSSM